MHLSVKYVDGHLKWKVNLENIISKTMAVCQDQNTYQSLLYTSHKDVPKTVVDPARQKGVQWLWRVHCAYFQQLRLELLVVNQHWKWCDNTTAPPWICLWTKTTSFKLTFPAKIAFSLQRLQVLFGTWLPQTHIFIQAPDMLLFLWQLVTYSLAKLLWCVSHGMWTIIGHTQSKSGSLCA